MTHITCYRLPNASSRNCNSATDGLVAAILSTRNRAGGGEHVRDEDEAWRIRGSASCGAGRCPTRAGNGAKKRRQRTSAISYFAKSRAVECSGSFASEKLPDYRHFPRDGVGHFAQRRRARYSRANQMAGFGRHSGLSAR